jgi:YD repeat-containing protein
MRGKDKVAVLLAGAAVALVPALAMAVETIHYRYDARGRLIDVVRNDGASANVVTNYTYDKADNRTSKTTTGSPNPPPP